MANYLVIILLHETHLHFSEALHEYRIRQSQYPKQHRAQHYCLLQFLIVKERHTCKTHNWQFPSIEIAENQCKDWFTSTAHGRCFFKDWKETKNKSLSFQFNVVFIHSRFLFEDLQEDCPICGLKTYVWYLAQTLSGLIPYRCMRFLHLTLSFSFVFFSVPSLQVSVLLCFVVNLVVERKT